jgi:hypothetical protein
MFNSELDYRTLVRMILSILAALLVLAASHRALRAATGHSFILSPADPYGVKDCQGKTQGCNQVVASAWCEAHGYGEALAYGMADDVTGTIAGTQPAKPDPNSLLLTCGD